jgi:hypothetical protein
VATQHQTRLTNGSPARVFHQGPQSTPTASMTGCSFSSPHPLPLFNVIDTSSVVRRRNTIDESLRNSSWPVFA